MPTRPVTWELDIPPGKSAAAPKNGTPGREVPALAALRNSLVVGRFEFLKIAAFSTFLFSFVAIAIHGSHVADPDNQFAANTGAAMGELVRTVSDKTNALTAPVRAATRALASSAIGNASGRIDRFSVSAKENPAPVMVAQSKAPAVHHVVRVHHRSRNDASAADREQVALVTHKAHHTQRRAHADSAVKGSSTSGVESDAQRSDGPASLPGFFTTQFQRAAEQTTDFVHRSIDIGGLAPLRSIVSSLREQFDIAEPQRALARDPADVVSGLLNRGSAMAACTALLLYLFFLAIVVQMRGSIRAIASRQSV